MEIYADTKCEKCGKPYIETGGDEDGAICGPSCECWLEDLLKNGDAYFQDFDDDDPIEPYFPEFEYGDYSYDFDENNPEWIAANEPYRDALNEQAAYQHYLSLKQKYWIGNYGNQSNNLPLYRILMLLEEGNIIPDFEISWLKKIELFTLTAHCYLQNSRLKQNVWDLLKACKFYRETENAQVVINLTNNLPIHLFPQNDIDDGRKKCLSYTWTSRGGAFRDLHEVQAAIDCANAALRIMPDNCGPHLLLGAVYFQKQDFNKADHHFMEAQRLGANHTYQIKLIDSEFQKLEPFLRLQAANYFLLKDPVFYGWVKKYTDC